MPPQGPRPPRQEMPPQMFKYLIENGRFDLFRQGGVNMNAGQRSQYVRNFLQTEYNLADDALERAMRGFESINNQLNSKNADARTIDQRAVAYLQGILPGLETALEQSTASAEGENADETSEGIDWPKDALDVTEKDFQKAVASFERFIEPKSDGSEKEVEQHAAVNLDDYIKRRNTFIQVELKKRNLDVESDATELTLSGSYSLKAYRDARNNLRDFIADVKRRKNGNIDQAAVRKYYQDWKAFFTQSEALLGELIELNKSQPAVEPVEKKEKPKPEPIAPNGYEWRAGRANFMGDAAYRKGEEDGIDSIIYEIDRMEAVPLHLAGAYAILRLQLSERASEAKALLAKVVPGENIGGMYGIDSDSDAAYTPEDKDAIKAKIAELGDLVKQIIELNPKEPEKVVLTPEQIAHQEAREKWSGARGQMKAAEAAAFSKDYVEKRKSLLVPLDKNLPPELREEMERRRETLTNDLEAIDIRYKKAKAEYALALEQVLENAKWKGVKVNEDRLKNLVAARFLAKTSQERFLDKTPVSARTAAGRERTASSENPFGHLSRHSYRERELARNRETLPPEKQSLTKRAQEKFSKLPKWAKYSIGAGAVAMPVAAVVASPIALAGIAGGVLGKIATKYGGNKIFRDGQVSTVERTRANALQNFKAGDLILLEEQMDREEAKLRKIERIIDDTSTGAGIAVAAGTAFSANAALPNLTWGDVATPSNFDQYLQAEYSEAPTGMMTEAPAEVVSTYEAAPPPEVAELAPPDTPPVPEGLRDVSVPVPEDVVPPVHDEVVIVPDAAPAPEAAPDVPVAEVEVAPPNLPAADEAANSAYPEWFNQPPTQNEPFLLDNFDSQIAEAQLPDTALETELPANPVEAPGLDAPRTPLEFTSAERLGEQEHLFRLGEQYGEGTVSEQMLAAWKDGAFEHLEWVPGPDEISTQEFLNAMNAHIDPSSPDMLSAEQIRGMGIEGGDFTTMQHGEGYDAVPLLDQMFPPDAQLPEAALESELPTGQTEVVPDVASQEVATASPETAAANEATSRDAAIEATSQPRVAVSVPPSVEAVPVAPAAIEVANPVLSLESPVTPELMASPDFGTMLFAHAKSEIAAFGGSPDFANKVVEEAMARVLATLPANSDLTFGQFMSAIDSIVAREQAVSLFAPAPGTEAASVFERIMDNHSVADLIRDERLNLMLQESVGNKEAYVVFAGMLANLELPLTDEQFTSEPLSTVIEELLVGGQLELGANGQTLSGNGKLIVNHTT